MRNPTTRTHPPARALRRSVHLADGVWSYACSQRELTLRSPDGTATTHVPVEVLLGHELDDDDEPPFGLTPSLAKAYAQRVLVEKLPWDPEVVNAVDATSRKGRFRGRLRLVYEVP